MKDNFKNSFALVLKHEGGYVNHPADPGGMTNLGVTKRAWEEYVGRPVDEQTMRSLTPLIVEPFYKQRYWDAVRGDELPKGIDYLMFDFAVNAGPRRAILTLQETLNINADGIIGPITLKKVNEADSKKLVNDYSNKKERFYRGLSRFNVFGVGWLNRATEAKESATRMVT